MSGSRALLAHPRDGIDRIASALETEGFDVTPVHTATAAVAKATTGAYDCLVSEYDLPGDDGVALLKALNESGVDIPAVLFTDTAGRESIPQTAYEHGADQVLRKNGDGSVADLVADVTTLSSGGPIRQPQQDIDGHEPSAKDIERAVNEAPVGLSICDPDLEDGPLVYVNDAWEEHTGYPKEEVLGRNPRFLQGPETDPATVERLSTALEREDPITVEIRNYRRDGTPFWNELTVAPVYDDDELVHYVGFQNDVTDRKTAERLAEERAEKIAAERQVLDRVLGRVNGLLSEISRILVEGTDADTITRNVCEEIADEPGYMGGWIAEVSSGTGRLELTASSGIPVEEDLTLPLAETPMEVRRAIDTDEVQGCSAGSCDGGPLAPKTVGGRRLLVVPVTYGHRRYGLLGIYSSEENALDRRERKVCTSVGKMIANGLHSVETTRILTTDRVVELCVGVNDESFSLSRIADGVGGPVEFLGTTRLDDDGCELYLKTDVDGADLASVESLPFVRSTRAVSETAEDLTFSVTATESPPFTRLAEHGGVVVDATGEPTGTELTIEAPPEQDVRSILDVLRAEYDGVELRSRVEQESRDRSVTEFAAEVDDRLTERQRSALKTAELNGYFEWPRPVDGSEIADRMGITRQTFHQHLRAAERKLVEAYVDP
ncbi:MAG: bacterio-opsin activator domain-containing protein [Halorubrum sp.]